MIHLYVLFERCIKGIMKVKKLVLLSIIAGLCILSGCDFFNKRSQDKKTGLVIVNVLDKELFDDCHIKGSINIPFESIEMCDDIIDKDAEVVCYCSNYFCSASGYACKTLKEKGFSRVYAYEAGTAEWFQQGLPVEGPAKSAYLTKHVAPHQEHDAEVAVITTSELAAKMDVLPR